MNSNITQTLVHKLNSRQATVAVTLTRLSTSIGLALRQAHLCLPALTARAALVQAVAGIPLTVYGKGDQVRGFLNIRDTMQCVELAATKPAKHGELRILNQFVETFSMNQLAEKVQQVGNQMGLNVEVAHLDNPRKEPEDHYYNPAHSGLLELGLQPHYLTDEVIAGMLETVVKFRALIDPSKIMSRVRWK